MRHALVVTAIGSCCWNACAMDRGTAPAQGNGRSRIYVARNVQCQVVVTVQPSDSSVALAALAQNSRLTQQLLAAVREANHDSNPTVDAWQRYAAALAQHSLLGRGCAAVDGGDGPRRQTGTHDRPFTRGVCLPHVTVTDSFQSSVIVTVGPRSSNIALAALALNSRLVDEALAAARAASYARGELKAARARRLGRGSDGCRR